MKELELPPVPEDLRTKREDRGQFYPAGDGGGQEAPSVDKPTVRGVCGCGAPVAA